MIRQVREAIAKELSTADMPWDVWAYKPDDVTGVPCVVVDRPSIAVNVQHNTFTVPVVVVGRRDGTEDAQAELDDAAAWVARNLAGPDFAVTSVQPVTATVADLTYPAYEVTVSCGVTVC